MLDRKLNVGIGTDGAACCDNQNMYESLRVAAYVSNGKGPDTDRWLASEEILEAATAGSARALGFGDKLGRIAKGYKADLVFLDLTHINWIPCNDPTNQLVHTEDGSAVHSVMVGGRMVVENRRPVGVDLRARQEGRGRARAPSRRQRRQQGAVRAACRASSTPSARASPRPPITSTGSLVGIIPTLRAKADLPAPCAGALFTQYAIRRECAEPPSSPQAHGGRSPPPADRPRREVHIHIQAGHQTHRCPVDLFATCVSRHRC